MDVVQHAEKVEAELDRFITKRSRQSDKARAEQELWKTSERQYLGLKRRWMRADHYRFEMDMCELHERLAAEH